MGEHQFKGIYNLGYGDAAYEHAKSKKATRPITVGLVLLTTILAFWTGRRSMRQKVTEAYDNGFEAGVREGTTQWGEWK